ncbi:MAG: sigma-70 family RNA polymerase sigma factor [Actinomycetota bacterium]
MDIDLKREVRRAAKGDGDAAAVLFDHYHPRVFRYAVARLRDEVEAEDVAAECFARILRDIRNFRWRGGGFEAWLFRIARNLVVDHMRQLSKEEAVAEVDTVALSNPEAITERLETSRELNEMLHTLPPEQREVLLLRFAAGLDAKEMGEVMGKSANAIRQLQFRALSNLRSIVPREVRSP